MTDEIIGRLICDKISLGQQALPDLYEQGYFGRPKGKGLELSLVEAAYLLGGHPGKSPAEFYVLVISERMPLPLQEIVQPVRVAGQMRKKLMLAIVDEESDITFYEAREKAMSGLMAGA